MEPKKKHGYESNMELCTLHRQIHEITSNKRNQQVQEHTLIVSTGCSNAQDRAQERPPANADLRTLPAGISTGGGTATTVAASNQILL